MRPPTRALRPVNPDNARPLRITAAAGTELAGASSPGTVHLFPDKRALHPEGLRHPRGVAASGLPPLRNIPHCCPPKESGPCLSPCLADHPLRPATRRRLGRPLPHQPADRPQAHPEAHCCFGEEGRRLPATCGISPPFDELSPTSGQVAYVLLNRSPLELLPKE